MAAGEVCPLIGRHSLFVTSGEQCWLFRKGAGDGNSVQRFRVQELECSHEEADTRILLHAQHAAEGGHGTVIIRSPDTDVAIIACGLAGQISARLILQTGTAQRMRYLDLTAIRAHLGNNVATSLIGMHSMTGCDSTSTISGRGKRAAFELLKTPRFQNTMSLLGNSFDVSEQLHEECEAFVCALYASFLYINELRYRLFCTRPGRTSQLPPCRDALRYHTMRAGYQAAIWRRALEAKPDILHPSGHGWTLDTAGVLSIHWMDQLPAPQALLELVSCGCTNGCATRRCTCKTMACLALMCASAPGVKTFNALGKGETKMT